MAKTSSKKAAAPESVPAAKKKPRAPKKATAPEEPTVPSRNWLFFVIAYTALALMVDTLRAMGLLHLHASMTQVAAWSEWAHAPRALTAFLSGPYLRTFDPLKFLTWFAVPFLLCVRTMDWPVIGTKRWKAGDTLVLVGLAVAGVLAMALIPKFPALRATYPDLSAQSDTFKWDYTITRVVWIAAWLPGWEFLHRYFLLRGVSSRWPRWGWVLVPLSETLYHLQKPGLEALGMALFSIVLTQWALRRKNILLPFLAHLVIEIEVVLAMLY